MVAFTGSDDVHGMLAQNILTSEGGATSHAAWWRQFGVPCVVGASMVQIDLENDRCNPTGLSSKKGIPWTEAAVKPTSKLHPTPDVTQLKNPMALISWADGVCGGYGRTRTIRMPAGRANTARKHRSLPN